MGPFFFINRAPEKREAAFADYAETAPFFSRSDLPAKNEKPAFAAGFSATFAAPSWSFFFYDAITDGVIGNSCTRARRRGTTCTPSAACSIANVCEQTPHNQ